MSTENTQYPYEPEFSVKKLVSDIIDNIKYVLKFKSLLAITLVTGGLLGALIAWTWTPSYTARLTFVVDDSKAGAGGLSALAGLAGFDLDGLTGGSGILAGDNVQELVKSTRLIKATLLTPYDAQSSLADKYAQVNKLNKKWLKYSPDGKITRFPVNGVNNTRLQDSLLHEMVELILKGDFSIAKTDKKLSFFEVNATMDDERLAFLFCKRMIKQSTDFYVSTKTKRLRENVARLQHRADSIGSILNRKTYNAAAATQSALDLNPAYSGANARVEVSEREKILLSGTYSETVKNLEASKTILAQETPTVQIVDEPELPLKKNRLKYSISIVMGVFLSGLAMSLFLVLRRNNIAAKNGK